MRPSPLRFLVEPVPSRGARGAWRLGASALALVAAGCAGSSMMGGSGGDDKAMSFFITSANPGQGANFGGLAGADAHCQALATSVGAGNRTWRAYLSGSANGAPVNARDRIGKGPWRNAKGEVVATDVEQLHSAANNLTKQTALTEKGEIVNGRGDTPNKHDILTGSRPDGRAFTDGSDHTCNNWSTAGEGKAMVGHGDRTGLDESEQARSWNSSHDTRGCSLEALRPTGGDGLLYCFAAN